MTDIHFTNGAIAVRERLLLGEKLLRFPEMTAEEVYAALRENGWEDAHDAETVCAAEEAALDAFIREFAPSEAELFYLLAPRDFHNMKAAAKAKLLGRSDEKMLATAGMVPIETVRACITEENYAPLGKEAAEVLGEIFSPERENWTGAEIGILFDRALYRALKKRCRGVLKTLLEGRADRVNLLSAARSPDRETAASLYVEGGSLKEGQLASFFLPEREREHALDRTSYAAFYGLCLAAREKGQPFTEAERALGSFEAEYFRKKKYELEGKAPFLYYVFRRRAEIENVRVVLVCLGAGLGEQEIRKRLRAV